MLLDPASPQSTELGTLISDALKYCQLEEHHTLIAGLLPLGTNILVSRIRLALLQQFAQAPMSPYSFSLWWKDNTPVEIQGKTLSNDYRPAIQGLLCANPTKLPPGKRRGAVALFYQSVETAQRGEKIEVVMIELAEGLKALGLTSKERVKDALKVGFTVGRYIILLHLYNMVPSRYHLLQITSSTKHPNPPPNNNTSNSTIVTGLKMMDRVGRTGRTMRKKLRRPGRTGRRSEES